MGSRSFASEPSELNLTNCNDLSIRHAKGLIPNPPNSLLEHSTLPLKLALCLLQHHAFTLGGSSELLESGLLLLEPSFA
jgi:hypothetical protein